MAAIGRQLGITRQGVHSLLNPRKTRARQLTEAMILELAEENFRATGQWPQAKTGPVLNHPRETWAAVDDALRVGRRGLPGGSSLPQLLARCRGVRCSRGRKPG